MVTCRVQETSLTTRKSLQIYRSDISSMVLVKWLIQQSVSQGAAV